jgi:hypothetical protein
MRFYRLKHYNNKAANFEKNTSNRTPKGIFILKSTLNL